MKTSKKIDNYAPKTPIIFKGEWIINKQELDKFSEFK